MMRRLSDQIHHVTAPGVDVQLLPWQIDSVVSLRASYPCPVDLAAGEGIWLDLLAAMLDKGTRSRTKAVINDQLERIGASISFSAVGDRVDVSARFLARDLDLVLGLVREQLMEPAFDEGELALIKGRIRAHLARQQSDPVFMGRNRLSRILFDSDHPAYEWSVEELTAVLDGIEVDALQDLHSRNSLWDGLRVAVVGDVSGAHVSPIFDELVLKPDGPGLGFAKARRSVARAGEPAEIHIEIPDRPNMNVLLAHPIDVKTVSDDYLPLWMGTFILGGNFSSRLMTTVRDERGLTYGIRSYLSGMGALQPGAWMTSVTLSSKVVQEGLQVTSEVLSRFVEEGISEEELRDGKSTMIGSYEVDLSTTAGVAGRLLLNMHRGWGPSRIDDHPDLIASVQAREVNRIIGERFDPSLLTVVTSGTRA
jgi:predicted Zn-dependent peptidase